MKKSFTFKEAIIVALYAGEIMLRNGAETYRVEDTMRYILKSLDFSYSESFVTPTGIFLSSDSPEGENPYSVVKRVRTRCIDLNKVSQVNKFSRSMVAGEIPFEKAMDTLREIDKLSSYNRIVRALSASLLAASFSMLLGGTWLDFLPAFITSLAVQGTVLSLEKSSFSYFLNNIAGGFVAAVMAILFFTLGFGNSIDKTIIGAIMTLVPGVAITNAIRDSISGDLMSGTARAAEAFLVAVAIASGVGIALKFWIDLF